MRKQTKMVAVLSAAALLAMGASMTSFAAGWQKDDAGVWHYYNSDDEMVTDEWKKDGGKYYHLNDEGDMDRNAWIDDDYYVGDDGAMLSNAWAKLDDEEDDENDDPTSEGEHWFYFGNKGKKTTSDSKKINGKTYYFNDEGEMQYGWYLKDDNVYYLGDEDQGWRMENTWLWLENPEEAADSDDSDNHAEDVANKLGYEKDMEGVDDEAWYWFQSSGKLYNGVNKKKIKGNYFMFNAQGQMLYEWINGAQVKLGSNAQLDGVATPGSVTANDMLWYRENGSDAVDGSRFTGWKEIAGSEDAKTDNDVDWYYFDKSEAKHAEAADANGLTDDGDTVYVKREKINGKYFAFNEQGQMQTGLQLINGNTYYFDKDGYQQTGKIAAVEEDDDDTYAYYFNSKNSGNGKGYTGEKDGYLYFMGKRLEADDDYKIYFLEGNYYLVNTKGKLQKSSTKKYDVELPNGTTEEDVKFDIAKKSYRLTATDFVKDNAAVGHIELCDNWLVGDQASGFRIVEKQSNNDFLTVDESKALH